MPRQPYHVAVDRVDFEALVGGDIRSLARAISQVESAGAGTGELLERIWAARGAELGAPSQVVGLTGPPGSGKSTMADALTSLWRSDGRRVAVLAVDPNSPFTGGAILGDRVRMQRHALDAGVFIRSMGARGHLGGVSLATRGAVRLLDALGWEMVVVETVGVGQSELEICEIADSVVVVTTPGTGDGIQVLKAGITEIADIFAVNKADMPGLDRVVRELRDMIRLSASRAQWKPPVVPATAAEGPEGVRALAEAIDRHRLQMQESGELAQRMVRRLRDEVVEIVALRARSFAREQLAGQGLGLPAAEARRADPEAAADLLLERFRQQGSNIGQQGAVTAAPRRDR